MKKQAEPRFLRCNDINSKAGTEKAALGRGGSDGVTMQVTPGPHSEYSNSVANTHCLNAVHCDKCDVVMMRGNSMQYSSHANV